MNREMEVRGNGERNVHLLVLPRLNTDIERVRPKKRHVQNEISPDTSRQKVHRTGTVRRRARDSIFRKINKYPQSTGLSPGNTWYSAGASEKGDCFFLSPNGLTE